MLNVVNQEKSLKFKWFQRLLNEDEHPMLWQQHLLHAFIIPVHLLLQINITPHRIQSFVKPGRHIPPFWLSTLKLWFKTRFIKSTDLHPNISELLQRPICYNSAIPNTSMKTFHKWYATLTRYNIFMVEDFLRKKHLHLQCPIVQKIARLIPTHWLLIKPETVDHQQSLYMGIVKQKWLVRAIHAHLRDMQNTPRVPLPGGEKTCLHSIWTAGYGPAEGPPR